MEDLGKILTTLDQLLLSLFNENREKENMASKTNHLNATGDKSLQIDLLMEEAIISYFKEQDFPCIIEAEEKGTTVLSKEPEYLILADPLDGSTNFSKGIPLVSYGVCVAAIAKNRVTPTFNDIITASVRSFYSEEFFLAQTGSGASLNGKRIIPSNISSLEQALLSIDIDRLPKSQYDLIPILWSIVKASRGTRRFGTNLLDMVYVGAGKIEAMIDLRNKLSAVHLPALFIAKEAGAVIGSPFEEKFNPLLKADSKMAFILANNEKLLLQLLHFFEK